MAFAIFKKRSLSVHQLSRWLIGGMSIVIVTVLIFLLWQNYRRVSAVRDDAIHARVKYLQMAIQSQIDDPLAVNNESLSAVLKSISTDEITYIGVLYRQKIIAESGVKEIPLKGDHSFPEVPFSIQVRERMVQAVAPFHGRPPMMPFPALTPARGGHSWNPMEVQLVFEFVPLEALALVGGAVQSLTMGVITSLMVLLATLLFCIFSVKAEKREKQETQRKRLEALGEMTAVLGHELRNPLTSLKGHAQLLQEGLPACHPGRESLDMVIKEAKRLEYLTNHILNFARPSSNKPSHFSIINTVSEAVESLPLECRVEVSSEEELPQIFGDQFKLRQALVNLFLNSYQVAPESVINCTVRKDGHHLVVAIRDHGPGISKENLNQIFEPYFTTKVKGTGLGLAIVKSTIDEFNGKIVASNDPDGGAVFTISLPY